MTQAYQVVGPCAHVKTATTNGVMTVMLFKSAILPPDVPPEQIKHLLSVKLIEPVKGVEPVPVEQPTEPADLGPPAGSEPTGGQGSPPGAGAEPDSDVKAQRAEARAKLPADGSLPDGRAGHAVWVEAAVDRGYAYEAASKADKKELMELLKQPTQ